MHTKTTQPAISNANTPRLLPKTRPPCSEYNNNTPVLKTQPAAQGPPCPLHLTSTITITIPNRRLWVNPRYVMVCRMPLLLSAAAHPHHPTPAPSRISYWSLPPTCITGWRTLLGYPPPPVSSPPSPPVSSQARMKTRLAPPLPRLRQRQRYTDSTPAGCARQGGDGGRVGGRGRGSHGSMLGCGMGIRDVRRR